MWRWGKRESIYLSLHCYHQNDQIVLHPVIYEEGRGRGWRCRGEGEGRGNKGEGVGGGGGGGRWRGVTAARAWETNVTWLSRSDSIRQQHAPQDGGPKKTVPK